MEIENPPATLRFAHRAVIPAVIENKRGIVGRPLVAIVVAIQLLIPIDWVAD